MSRMIIVISVIFLVVQPCWSVLTFSVEMDTLDIETAIELLDSAPGEGIWDQLQMSGNRVFRYSYETSWSLGVYWNPATENCDLYYNELDEAEADAYMMMKIHGDPGLGIEDEYLGVYYGYREKWSTAPVVEVTYDTTTTVDSCEYHVAVTVSVKQIYGFRFEPGTYSIRYGFLPFVCGTAEECYNSYIIDYDEVTFHVPSYTPPPPQSEFLHLTNLDEVWRNWIPEANLDDPNRRGNNMVLNIRVESSNSAQQYFLRAKLGSTRLPARYTNDYSVPFNSISEEDQEKFGNISYFNALVEADADLKLLQDDIGPNRDWVIEHDTLFAEIGGEDRAYGRFLAMYEDPVSHRDEIELDISSFDFGADGMLYLRLDPVELSPGYPTNFNAQRMIRDSVGDTIYGLCIPRDEEYSAYKRFFAPEPGKLDSILVVTYGDGIADAWEEKYVDPSLNPGSLGGSDYNYGLKEVFSSHNDSLIYPSILELRPEYDDSFVQRWFYPDELGTWQYITRHGQLDSLKKVGDGLANLEGYRGINGIASHADPDNISFSRIGPHRRHVFYTLYSGTKDYYSIPNVDRFFRGTTSADWDGIEETAIFIRPNDITDPFSVNSEEVEHYRLGFMYWYYDDQWHTWSESDGPHSNPFPTIKYGARYLDRVFRYPVNDEYDTVIIWITADYLMSSTMNGYLSNEVGFTVSGNEIGFTLSAAPPRSPERAMFSYIFTIPVGVGVVNHGFAPGTPEYAAEYNKALSQVTAHELGHFVGMKHPKPAHYDTSIMCDSLYFRHTINDSTYLYEILTEYGQHDYKYFLLDDMSDTKGGR